MRSWQATWVRSRKLEYTVIGDPVNLAARLQELSPELGATVLVSGETAAEASNVGVLRSFGAIVIRGRAETVEVFAVDEEAIGPAPTEALHGTASPSDG